MSAQSAQAATSHDGYHALVTEFLSCRPNLEVADLAPAAAFLRDVNSTTAMYIGVAGVDDGHERCAGHGARIITGLEDHPWGLRDFVIEMPGGHRLALGEWITQSHQ